MEFIYLGGKRGRNRDFICRPDGDGETVADHEIY